MKYLVLVSALLLVGCEFNPFTAMVNDPGPGSSTYEECLVDFREESYIGAVRMVANNFKYAKEIREDAKVCIANTAVGNGKTNKEDDIEACTKHAYSINGGALTKDELGYDYALVYGDVVKCRKRYNVPEGK